MVDIELGGHTVASHGAKLARFHLHDWIVLLLLGGLEFTFYTIDPFSLFVGKDTMAHLKYPLKNTTVPFWAVPIGALVLPCLVYAAMYMRRRNVYDLHYAVLGTLYSVLATGMITDALKDAVGRPRPNYFWRCFPDGKEVYDNVTSGALCHGQKNMVKDGHKSFPSGHASWSFAGLGFFSWYLAGKIQAFDRRGHIAKLCLVFLPLLVASAVSISLVNDYMHHWGDVLGGGLLGLVIASFCYLQFFPPPYHADGWRPHAYFQALADTRNNASITQRPETETRNMASGGGGGSSTEASLTVDMEDGNVRCKQVVQ